MSSPLAKFASVAADGLHFGRINEDGLPFEGEVRPRREQEYDEMAIVRTFHHKFFELGNPEDMKKYDEVMDRVFNNWYEQKCIQRFIEFNGKMCHYLEWCVPVLSDGKPYKNNAFDARML